MTYILGFHGGPRGSHESGVALLNTSTGEVELVIQEERFNRFKSSISCFPTKSLDFIFSKKLILPNEIQSSASAGETYEDMRLRIPDYLEHNFGVKVPHESFHHQVCHASNAFFSSGFNSSLIVCLDGIGDRKSGVIAFGENYRIKVIRFLEKSESVGFYWSLLCQAIGYDGLEDAYKVMGLAPYGTPCYDLNTLWRYKGNLKFKLNTDLFENKYKIVSKHPAERVYVEEKFGGVFGDSFQRRLPFHPIREIDRNIASSAQVHLERELLRFFADLKLQYPVENLCLAGGVFLNSHFIGELQSSSLFQRIYLPPSPGDGGLALGAAQLSFATQLLKPPKPVSNACLGPSYSATDIRGALTASSCTGYLEDVQVADVADLLVSGKVVGFFSGRSEVGPRALGARSILASPSDPKMKDIVNKKIKFRELYRPFAPSVHRNYAEEYFHLGTCNYDFMSSTVLVKNRAKNEAPSIVHIDGTARIHIPKQGSSLEVLLEALISRGHPPILLNTSFNLKGEPNVESPTDAIRTFFSSGLDALYMDGFLLHKLGQPLEDRG